MGSPGLLPARAPHLPVSILMGKSASHQPLETEEACLQLTHDGPHDHGPEAGERHAPYPGKPKVPACRGDRLESRERRDCPRPTGRVQLSTCRFLADPKQITGKSSLKPCLKIKPISAKLISMRGSRGVYTCFPNLPVYRIRILALPATSGT